MATLPGSAFSPRVSVVLTTRDRPRFLSQALRCYAAQTYSNRELIVADDGERYPVAPEAVAALGGKIVRLPPGTALGTKLNAGFEEARGGWCQKMDDDDWYAPEFLERMVEAVGSGRAEVCRPVVAFVMPFLFFDLARWQIRRSVNNNMPGATLFFPRDGWRHRPFRPLTNDEDFWFAMDQYAAGAHALPVRAIETFLAVRHRGDGDRGHTWVHQADGRRLEAYLDGRPVYRTPEDLLPDRALAFYREMARPS